MHDELKDILESGVSIRLLARWLSVDYTQLYRHINGIMQKNFTDVEKYKIRKIHRSITGVTDL